MGGKESAAQGLGARVLGESMKQDFMVSVRSTAEGYEVVVSGVAVLNGYETVSPEGDVGVARTSAPDLDQALRMAATFMQTCCEEALRFP